MYWDLLILIHLNNIIGEDVESRVRIKILVLINIIWFSYYFRGVSDTQFYYSMVVLWNRHVSEFDAIIIQNHLRVSSRHAQSGPAQSLSTDVWIGILGESDFLGWFSELSSNKGRSQLNQAGSKNNVAPPCKNKFKPTSTRDIISIWLRVCCANIRQFLLRQRDRNIILNKGSGRLGLTIIGIRGDVVPANHS